MRLAAALFWQDGHFRLAIPSDKTRQLCSAYLVYLSWSAAARPGSCCLVRNSELWQGLRWLNCPKPEPSAATQSNKSSKERWRRERQTNSPLLFFLSAFFSLHNITDRCFGNRKRSKSEKRQRNTDTDRPKEEIHQHQIHVRILLREFIVEA